MNDKRVSKFKNIFHNFQFLFLDTITKWCLPALSSKYKKRILKFYLVIDLKGSEMEYIKQEVIL